MSDGATQAPHDLAVAAHLAALVDAGREGYRPRLDEVRARLGLGPYPRPTAAPSPAPGPTNADLIANAESCPHRVPMPEGRRSPCGCQWLCAAEKSPRHRRGGVLLSDCWDCPVAPRRNANEAGGA